MLFVRIPSVSFHDNFGVSSRNETLINLVVGRSDERQRDGPGRLVPNPPTKHSSFRKWEIHHGWGEIRRHESRTRRLRSRRSRTSPYTSKSFRASGATKSIASFIPRKITLNPPANDYVTCLDTAERTTSARNGSRNLCRGSLRGGIRWRRWTCGFQRYFDSDRRKVIYIDYSFDLLPRSRGNGESTGVTTYSNHELESHDMHALIRSITSSDAATRPIPHPVTILAIGGHSKGGIAALFHVRNYPSSSPDEVINASSLFFQQGDPEDKTFFRIGMWAEIKKIGKMTTSKYRHLGKLHDYFITDEDIYTREKMVCLSHWAFFLVLTTRDRLRTLVNSPCNAPTSNPPSISPR